MQRPPARQGDLCDLDHRPAGDRGDRQRPAAAPHRTQPPPWEHDDHLALRRPRADGDLSGDGHGGSVPHRSHPRRRPRIAGRDRPARGHAGATGPPPAAVAHPQRADDRALPRPLRAVPVHPDRCDRRPCAAGRLRAGDADAADLRQRSGRDHRRPRARPPVVRQLGQSQPLAGHVAERGLCDLGPVALAGGARRADDGSGIQRPRGSAGESHGPLGAATGGDPDRGRAVRELRLHPGCDGGRGASPAGRHRDLLRHPPRVDRRPRLRQRDDGGLHRPRRVAVGRAARRPLLPLPLPPGKP